MANKQKRLMREDYLGVTKITVTDMALRLARAFGTIPELWINLQKNYDLWHAEHASSDWKRVHPLSKQLLYGSGESGTSHIL
ncbi:MAG: hypothetical protein U9P07_12145 [Pseudomonadota bacterium]|nr:hypothetical protein [Pseudomonadota bacterium]